MKLLHMFLINAIHSIKCLIKFIFHNEDYSIINTCIEYKIDHSKDMNDTDNAFWKNEYSNWVDESTEYYAEIDEREDISNPPSCVIDPVVRRKFWYNNKAYKFLTYDLVYEWPPVKSMGVHFHIPLSSAQLMDCNDKPVKDMLPKICKYAGPHNDFYKSDVKIRDMLWYNDETMKNLPTIKLKNVFGFVKCVPTDTGKITDLRIP